MANEYICVDALTVSHSVIADTMEHALKFWVDTNPAEPKEVHLNRTGIVTASDVKDPQVTVTNGSPLSGTVYPSAAFTVREGSEVLFTAVPQTGFTFTGFTRSMGGVTTAYTDNPSKIPVTADCTITVAWASV